MIEVRNVSFRYPKTQKYILHDVSFRLDRGEIAALTGANGCGKTTLARMIAGMIKPESGCVLIDGQDTKEMSLFAIGQRVGYLFQEPGRQLFCDTVENEIAFGLRNLKKSEEEIRTITEEYLQLMGITHLRKAFPGTLSQGEKQRVVISCILSMGTDYLLLDEPTNGLDMKRRAVLRDTLLMLKNEKNCGIALISHDRAFIDSVCDREEAMCK